MIAEIFDPANYILSLYALPTFISSTALALLGLLVLLRERASRESALYCLMSLTVTVWLFAFSWMYCAEEKTVALWWARAAYLGIPFVCSAVYHFTVSVLRLYERRKRFVWAGWAMSAVFSATALWTDDLISGVDRYWWGYYPEYGRLGAPFTAFFALMSLISLRHYWNEYRKAKPGVHRNRVQWFLIAFAIASLSWVDYLPKYGVELYPFGYAALVGWLLFVERAIWRYQLVDLTPAFAADQIIRTVADPLLVLDQEGVVQVVNQAACCLFGRTEAQVVGAPLAAISADFLPAERLETLLRTGQNMSYEVAYRDGRGEPVALDVSASVKRGRSGRAVGVVCVARDMTARKRAEDALRASEERFHSVAQSATDAIISADGRGRIQFWNKGAEAIFGYTEDEVMGRPLAMLMPERYREAHQKGLERAYATGERRVAGKTIELNGLRKNGREFPLELSLSMWKAGGDTCFSGIIRDITERKQAEARLTEAAYYDFLTGLPNRRLFMELLAQAIARARRIEKSAAVLFLDLDNFKLINDTLGHVEGDAVLKIVANRLTGCVRQTDAVAHVGGESAGDTSALSASDREGNVVARLGGDEFTFLLEGIHSARDVERIAQRVLDAVAKPIRLKGHELVLTASIGIVLYPGDGTDRESLIKNADVAMYSAKRQKNTFRYYSPDMNARAVERLNLEADLRRALDHGEFELYYQPFVDARTGLISGVEALVRWHHHERGPIPPDTFIPLAEESGLIVPLSQWTLRTACIQVGAWRARGFPSLRVAVNLSRSLCQHHNLIDLIEPVLKDTRLAPEGLELELTESVLIQDRERAVSMLRALSVSGIRISIDDFGVEYSSLSYLRQLPITTLKIDQSFVREVTSNRNDAAIVQTIITLARCLKLTVIAEGVETDAQAAFLRDQQCDELQGYYFYRPIPAEAMTGILRAEGGANG